MSKPISKTLGHMVDQYPITSGTVRRGMPVTVSSGAAAETTGTDAWGIALNDADYSDFKNRWVSVHRFGAGIVPVLCSASISAGTTVQPASNGVAALTVGGSTTVAQCIGRLVEAGAEGGLAGCDVGNLTLTMS